VNLFLENDRDLKMSDKTGLNRSLSSDEMATGKEKKL